MARFKADQVENYGGQGGAGFFSLKNDKDVASVRFLYNNIEDVEGYAVHEVDVDDKKRTVNCLREYNEPIDKCPFCREKMYQAAKLYIPLYNEDANAVQIWERGKKFFAKISSICARYAQKGNLVCHTFDIERNGKAGSTQTTYEIYETGEDVNVSLEDYDMPQILGGLVLDKTAEDMEYYLENGYFPDAESNEPIRRRGRTDTADEEPARRSGGRRTPSGRRGDAF